MYSPIITRLDLKRCEPFGCGSPALPYSFSLFLPAHIGLKYKRVQFREAAIPAPFASKAKINIFGIFSSHRRPLRGCSVWKFFKNVDFCLWGKQRVFPKLHFFSYFSQCRPGTCVLMLAKPTPHSFMKKTKRAASRYFTKSYLIDIKLILDWLNSLIATTDNR